MSPAKDLAITFAKEIWRVHGPPLDIVSDTGSVFITGFWKELMEHLGVDLSLSTAFHPQTDGQIDRVNLVFQGYFRHYSNFQQDDWAELLPLAEHAYNTVTAESTKVSPFFANYGFNPETQWVKPLVVDPTKMDWTNPAAVKLYSVGRKSGPTLRIISFKLRRGLLSTMTCASKCNLSLSLEIR